MDLAAWTAKLLITAALLGGFAAPPGPPVVTLVPAQDLSARLCGGDCRVRGAYVPGQGVMLDQSLGLENPLGRSVLLHELVHYLQDIAGHFAWEPPCARWIDREVEAYRIQDSYLSRYNLGIGAALDSALALRPAGCTAGREDVSAQQGGQQ